MELRPLCLMLLLVGLCCTQTENPKLTVSGNPQSFIYTGDSVTLSCNLQSTGWSFFWYKSYPHSTYLITKDTHSNTLSVTGSNEGQTTYYCKAGRRNYISDFSNSVTIIVRARPKPVVKIHPAENVFIGETVTLTCDIQTGGSWEYHWYRSNEEFRAAAGKKTYTITDVKDSNKGPYSCKGTQSSDPKYTQSSDAVTLTVSEKTKPKLTSDFAGAALTGNSVTLSCTLNLQSAGWKFYWKKDTQSRETETETDHYIIRSVTVSDGGQYRCRAGRGNPVYYTHDSEALWVNVIESPKPVLSFEPDKQVFIGEKLMFSCDLQTEENTKWTYDWFRNDHPYQTPIYYSGKYTCRGRRSDSHISKISDPVTLTVSEKPEPELTSDVKGAALTGNSVTLYCTLKLQSVGWKFYWNTPTQSRETETHSYTIRSVSVSDGGQYWCRAGRGNPVYYTHYSDALSVNVIENPKPVVIIKPDTHVFRGETVTFRCEIERGRDTEWRYDWYKDDNTLDPKHTTQEFSISSVPDSSRGKYTCRGRRRSDNQISKTSDSVTLTVSEKPEPELTSDLKGAALTGNSVTLYCTLKLQSAGWKFYWSKDTQRCDTETETGHFFFRSVSVSDGGQYWCRAGRGNPVYYTHYSDALWVNVTDKSASVSLIINPSRSQHFTAASLSLSCEDQRDSTGWTVRRYTHSEASLDCSSVSGSTCNISSLSPSHTGVYWCQSESGERSKSVNITVHNGDVILDSPVHPVTEGNPLTLHCLYRNTKISTGIDFYKNDSIIQNQTTGVMTISSVSKSDEGFYHCKHPERGESPKSWISVRDSPSSATGVIIGLSLTFTFVIIMIVMIMLFHHKKKKDAAYQTPSTVNQDTTQPPADDNVYESADVTATDVSAAGPSSIINSQALNRNQKQNNAGAGPSDVIYTDIEMKKQKKPKRKQGKSSNGDDTVYSDLKQNTDEDAAAGPSDVTYAKIDLKKIKKPKKKQGKNNEGSDTLYSELKKNIDKGP